MIIEINDKHGKEIFEEVSFIEVSDYLENNNDDPNKILVSIYFDINADIFSGKEIILYKGDSITINL